MTESFPPGIPSAVTFARCRPKRDGYHRAQAVLVARPINIRSPGRVLSPRDTRYVSHNSHTGGVLAQIDREQNHKSRATKGSMPCRPAPQHHRLELRSRKTPAD